MSTVRLLDIVILGVLLLVSFRLVPSTLKIWQIYSGTKGRRLEDASSFAPPPPPAVQAAAILLQPYGFTRIGERSTALPGNERRYEWNFVDEPTTTYVAVVPIRTVAAGRAGRLLQLLRRWLVRGHEPTREPRRFDVRTLTRRQAVPRSSRPSRCTNNVPGSGVRPTAGHSTTGRWPICWYVTIHTAGCTAAQRCGLGSTGTWRLRPLS